MASLVEKNNINSTGCVVVDGDDQSLSAQDDAIDDGESNDSIGVGGNSVRRPMNAFLIFCKQHRSMVREKYPHLENRSVTKILGEWWANLETEEKTSYTDLARQYKEAFMKANPDFKWYKLPAAPVRTLITRPSNQRPPKSDSWNSSLEECDDKSQSAITPGKLADETQIGGLSSLFSSLVQDPQPSSDASAMSKPPKKRYLQSLQLNSKSENNDNSGYSSDVLSANAITLSSGKHVSSDAPPVPDKSTSNACSALLKLAEMCSSKEYAQLESSKCVMENKITKQSYKEPYQNHTNRPNVKSSHGEPAFNSSETDEPLDLCTERVKKFKTSHLIDHFVCKFLENSLCADSDRQTDRTFSSFDSIQASFDRARNTNSTSPLNENGDDSVMNVRNMADDKCVPICTTSKSENSLQSSVSSDNSYGDSVADIESNEIAINHSPNKKQQPIKINATGDETNSCDSHSSRSLKSPVDDNTGNDGVNDNCEMQPKNGGQHRYLCGPLAVSKLFSGFREAPNSKACDLLSRAIDSVIDNAYDKLDFKPTNSNPRDPNSGEQSQSNGEFNSKLSVPDEVNNRHKQQKVKSNKKVSSGNQSPRKSPRSCKGRRYKELMSGGDIHLPKERRLSSGSTVSRHSSTTGEDDDDVEHAKDDDNSSAFVTNNVQSPENRGKTKKRNVSSSWRNSGSFSLEEQMAALPKCDIQSFESKKRRKKHSSGDEISAAHSFADSRFNSDTDPNKDPDFKPSQSVIRRIRRYSESSDRISSSDWPNLVHLKNPSRFITGDFDLEAEMATLPKCNINVLNKKRNKRRNASGPSAINFSETKSVDRNHKEPNLQTNKIDEISKDPNRAASLVGSHTRKVRRKSIALNDDGSARLDNTSLVTLAVVATTPRERKNSKKDSK